MTDLHRCASTYYKEMPCAGTNSAKVSEKLFEYDYEIVCKSFYLKDNITDAQFETWFNSKCINVFNKTHCGNGGTTGFINYAIRHTKGLLILVPNVSICKSKEEEYKDYTDICCVYGGSGQINKNALVVIATYDQFHKMMKQLNNYGIDYNEDWSSTLWSGRTILIDEYHKITDECSFRNVCYDVTKLIKEQDNGVILMSATPHWGYIGFLKEYIPEKEVKTYTVKYEDEEGLLIEKGAPRLIQIYDVRKKIADIISKMYRSPKNKQIVVFYNNRKEIKDYLLKMNVRDVEVLCSSEHAEEFDTYYSGMFNPTKKLHFMTSAYFAGCDIKEHIDACVIIGSKSQSFLSYSSRDIKQMIGRFREGCSGVHLFYNGRVQDVWDYSENKTKYDQSKKFLQENNNDWNNDEVVVTKQQSLMLKDRLDNAEHWSSLGSLKNMLQEAGYIVRECKIGEFESICSPKKLSSKETKERIIKGENVNWDENSMASQYKAYFDRFGAESLNNASAWDIKNWYKIRKNVGEEENKLSLMLPAELFNTIGLTEGYYSGSYLMDCLKYVGVKCCYEELPLRFIETFGAYAVLMSAGKKGNSKIKYLVINADWGNFVGESLYNNIPTKFPQSDIDPLISLNHKKTLDGHLLAKTFLLHTVSFRSLNGIELYDWVMGDKEHRLPLVKAQREQSSKWNNIKNYEQSKISEMVKYTTSEYRHIIKEMNYINILICDIDSGLSFGEFKERYKNYRWTAYPTLNNTSEDWTKFRVIVYLDQPVRLEGEHNLKVLKLLRTLFCPHEDPNHQMASYINKEDWEQKYDNNGALWHIDQSLVDNLTLRIENIRNYMTKAFESVDSITTSVSSLSLEEAKGYFEKSFKSGDGARHKALYIIKNRLAETDRVLFEGWLMTHYPGYLTNWRSHKVQ